MYLSTKMKAPDWLSLVGYFWCRMEILGSGTRDLIQIIKMHANDPLSAIPELMSERERAALADLPDQITIYRGCGPRNKRSASWTLSRAIAARFPFTRAI